jgi:Fe-S cluster assembly protein SufD
MVMPATKLRIPATAKPFQGMSLIKIPARLHSVAHPSICTMAIRSLFIEFEYLYLLKQFSHLTLNNAIINNTSLVQAYDFNVYHLNKDSESTLTNYAICKDSSTLKINSNGIIKQGCSKSKIMQKSKGIILDLTSAISANPLLQIDEFDVEANHGASIGAIDDEDLYYLMSRGLTKSQSEQLIVSGYMQPILSKMNEEQLQKYASFLIENKLK